MIGTFADLSSGSFSRQKSFRWPFRSSLDDSSSFPVMCCNQMKYWHTHPLVLADLLGGARQVWGSTREETLGQTLDCVSSIFALCPELQQSEYFEKDISIRIEKKKSSQLNPWSSVIDQDNSPCHLNIFSSSPPSSSQPLMQQVKYTSLCDSHFNLIWNLTTSLSGRLTCYRCEHWIPENF